MHTSIHYFTCKGILLKEPLTSQLFVVVTWMVPLQELDDAVKCTTPEVEYKKPNLVAAADVGLN